MSGLFGLVAKGVAMGAEYREHRKEQKQARAAAEDSNEQNEQTASPPADRHHDREPELPPYAAVPATTSRTLASGPPVTSDEKKAEISSEEESDSDYQSIEDDEELLELDEALTPTDTKGLPTYEESEQEYQPVDELVRDVMSSREPPPTDINTPRPQLPCPVILPQRRPRKKARGFIRAYSPVLADCGISQEVFLKFLKNFHKSSQASPIFPIIQISAAISGFAPSVIAMAVCTAAQIAAGVGAEVQSRARTNNFLDCINEELFKPAGLYCMIVKYKSDADIQQSQSGIAGLANLIRAERVDVTTNQTIAKYTRTTSDDPASKTMGDRMKGLRLASSSTKGTAMLPDSAPLIFPDIDHKVSQAGPETFKDKTKDAKKFLADYLDRRAQMEYATQDPNSSLTIPEQQRSFKTSIADPNHPMHSGGLIALVSGGKLTPRMDKRAHKMERAFSRDERRMARGREPRTRRRYGNDYHEELYARLGLQSDRSHARHDRDVGEGSSSSTAHHRGRGRRNRKGGPLGAVKRIMKEDVLYLMIVNMPTEAELAEAREELGISE